MGRRPRVGGVERGGAGTGSGRPVGVVRGFRERVPESRAQRPGRAPRTGQSRQVTLVAGPTRLAPDSHSTLPAPSTLTSFHSVSAPMGAVPDHTG